MALVSVEEVLEETGVTYDDFGFANNTLFESWISKKVTWVDNKIESMVGTYYTDASVIPDLEYAEIFWVYATMLRRRQSMHAGAIESGFAIASLRIDSVGGATEATKSTADDYFKKAQILLDPYTTYQIDQFIIVEDENE